MSMNLFLIPKRIAVFLLIQKLQNYVSNVCYYNVLSDIAKLVAALLATNDLSVNQELREHKTVDILLDLFFKYSLNNFLHTQVS